MNSRVLEEAEHSDSRAGESFGRRLCQLMAAEHANLDRLLAQVSAQEGAASIESYGEFRKGLLRHISIEEKILLPMAERRRGGEPLALAVRLRLDHGALAALMMLPPSATTLSAYAPCWTRIIHSKRPRAAFTNSAKGSQVLSLMRSSPAAKRPRRFPYHPGLRAPRFSRQRSEC